MNNSIVPFIDIAPFLHGGADDKARVAAEVDKACREIGFLVVSGHDVPDALIDAMHGMSDDYFALPHWEKMRHKIPADRLRGYSPSEHHSLAYSMDEETPEDLREAFNMGPFDHALDEYHFGEGGARYFAPNIWPDRPGNMRQLCEEYFREMEKLAGTLMRIFALALGLDETFFEDKTDKHITNFCINHYPAQAEPPKEKQLRGGAHCDYGSLTIVHTDTDIGGLQVFRKDGTWETVPRIAGSFAINIGDLMAEWTNDQWVSTLHRVTNPPRDKAHLSKTSLLFFHQPNYDAAVECLPNCHGADNPPKYAPTTSGEHIIAKFEKLRAPEFESAAAD
ncbi:MAG: isopenicillin N synthase family oxygenase [Rhodospirillaceae bacterium]|jgi:isopenicillin N synthase-like dioxygenase|nr:isopenicillin N synthase family oxygenase [Rhodospirillaceae bacterium]MBT5675063.1 isopenicillin N synthase family oxygenase [Rhodospirillaceae bacterium]